MNIIIESIIILAAIFGCGYIVGQWTATHCLVISNEKKKSLFDDEEYFNMYASNINKMIIDIGKRYNTIVDKEPDRVKKINTMSEFIEERLLLNTDDHDEFGEFLLYMDDVNLNEYIRNIIDSNYEEIFKNVKIEELVEDIEPDTKSKPTNKPSKNNKNFDMSSDLMNFYNYGEDV